METSTLLIFIGLAVLIGGLIVLRQSQMKGRWGIGSLTASCPRCGAQLPAIRKPASFHEMVWGGWTCERCGCKVDKYGREHQ